MTKQQLEDALAVATRNKQKALLVWASKSVYDVCYDQMVPGTGPYSDAMGKVSGGYEAVIYGNYKGFTMLGLIAVSVEKLNTSDKFFKSFLEECQDYNGPITLVPSQRLINL